MTANYGDQKQDLSHLETEGRNAATNKLDTLVTTELVQVLHAENHSVAAAVDATLPVVAVLVDRATQAVREGGRIFYVGAGTSGRLGVLDASECPPTFGVTPDLVQGIIAGGLDALVSSIEGAEDNFVQGKEDLAHRAPQSTDVVIGIAASGRTPYVIGALDYARSIGCTTAAIVNVRNSVLSQHAEFTLEAVTGSEPISGSTRMKAGTAQKLLLNLISTAVMVKLGKVYDNLMVDVRATNEKLRARAIRIVMEATGRSDEVCSDALLKADWHAKTAILMLMVNASKDESAALLAASEGNLRMAMQEFQSKL